MGWGRGGGEGIRHSEARASHAIRIGGAALLCRVALPLNASCRSADSAVGGGGSDDRGRGGESNQPGAGAVRGRSETGRGRGGRRQPETLQLAADAVVVV